MLCLPMQSMCPMILIYESFKVRHPKLAWLLGWFLYSRVRGIQQYIYFVYPWYIYIGTLIPRNFACVVGS
jgi:hypothetical protein